MKLFHACRIKSTPDSPQNPIIVPQPPLKKKKPWKCPQVHQALLKFKFLRTMSDDELKSMADSYERIGLLSPIVIFVDNSGEREAKKGRGQNTCSLGATWRQGGPIEFARALKSRFVLAESQEPRTLMKPACLFIVSGYVPLHDVAGSAFAGRVVCRALELTHDPFGRARRSRLGHIADINHMATPVSAKQSTSRSCSRWRQRSDPRPTALRKHAHALAIFLRDCVVLLLYAIT